MMGLRRTSAHRRGTATLLAAAILTAACAGDGTASPDDVAGDAEVAAEPVVEPDATVAAADAGRTVGIARRMAATAPEWSANAGVNVHAGRDGTFAFAQILKIAESFELGSITFETHGMVGVDGPTTLRATVDVRALPDGDLPERFDAMALPELGTAEASVALEALQGYETGRFRELRLAEPVDVPAGRILIVVRLRPVSGAGTGAGSESIALVGRRGAIGGSGTCADHNPEGRFLSVEDSLGDGATGVVVRADDELSGPAECSEPGGAAAFNLTMRLSGRPLSPTAAAEVAAAVSVPAAVPAYGEAELAAGAPADGDGSARTTAPEPTVRVRTFPESHRFDVLGLAGFWWGRSAFAEVAQSLRVTEGFDLTELRFGVHRVSAIEDWLNVPEEAIAWNHDVIWSGTVPDVGIRVTIWPLAGPGGATLDLSGVPPLTEQTTTASVPIAAYTSSRSARVRLATPVRLDPGHYLISLGIDAVGDPTVFNWYTIGRNHGYTDATGFFRDQGRVSCDYPAPTTDYPDGRAYYRVFSVTARPTLLSNATGVFREHRSKVLAESLNECRSVGNPDYFLPGDLELTLLGD